MAEPAPSTHPSWLKIGGLGCAAVIALVALFVGSVAGLTLWGYRRAFVVGEEIDRNYGAFDSYRVPADGTIAPDRMARFLAIRKALLPRCAEVTDVTQSFKAVEAMAGENRPDPGEEFRRVGKVLSLVPSVGLILGEYLSDRNAALQAEGVGLGEYTWIYVTSYFAYLGQTPVRVLDEHDRPSLFEHRVFPEIARVVERHVADRGLAAGEWVDELARLRADAARVPFRDNLPAALADALVRHHDALAAVACPGAAELDLAITVRRGALEYDYR